MSFRHTLISERHHKAFHISGHSQRCPGLQKLAASLAEKGLSPATGITASDEADHATSIATFLQYGKALDVVDLVSTHSYQGTYTDCF